jgi:hypothetical protein
MPRLQEQTFGVADNRVLREDVQKELSRTPWLLHHFCLPFLALSDDPLATCYGRRKVRQTGTNRTTNDSTLPI